MAAGCLPPSDSDVVLWSDDLRVTLTPDKGCDILELVDRATGVDVLVKAPWGRARPYPVVATGSFDRFMELYSGGWQVLVPNAGDAATVDGVEWPFHGEACVAPWRVVERSQTSARFEVALVTAPLVVTRAVSVDGRALVIDERVTNRSDAPLEVMWCHHPTFGAPFVDEHATLHVDAATFVADEDDAARSRPARARPGPWRAAGTKRTSTSPACRARRIGARCSATSRTSRRARSPSTARRRGSAWSSGGRSTSSRTPGSGRRHAGPPPAVVRPDVRGRDRAVHHVPGTRHRARARRRSRSADSAPCGHRDARLELALLPLAQEAHRA